MTKTVVREVEGTVAEYLREIPGALGHMDFEVRGNRVIGHSDQGTVVINLTYEGERHFGSLDLPLTNVEIICLGYTDAQAEEFLKHYDARMLRGGGG
jgi:hypothetical protein